MEAAKRARVRLILAGTVDSNVAESLRYFQQAIEPEIDHKQTMYIGAVNWEQKIELLSRARVLLNPIEWDETFGMVLIEAMALGCPVISFLRGSAPEIVLHGQTGFLARNMDELVHFIWQIDEIDSRVTQEHAWSAFSARTMAEKYEALYRRISQNGCLPERALSE